MATFEIQTDQVFVMRVDGDEVLGSLCLNPTEDGFELYCLYVSPQHRRQGVARSLIERAIEYAADKALYVEPGAFADQPMATEALRAWYVSLGFCDVGGVMRWRKEARCKKQR